VNGDSIVLSEQQKSELGHIAQPRSLPAGYVFRAKLLLALSSGESKSNDNYKNNPNDPEELTRSLHIRPLDCKI
jgi:hypothetical protein